MWPFTKKYDDSQIMACARSALEYETLLNATNLAVDSDRGVVKLTGKVNSMVDKSRATDAVHEGLTGARIDFDRIVDDIVVGKSQSVVS